MKARLLHAMAEMGACVLLGPEFTCKEETAWGTGMGFIFLNPQMEHFKGEGGVEEASGCGGGDQTG